MRELVALDVRESEDPRGVLDRLLPLDGAVGHDLSDVILAVLLLHVPDHVTAPAVVEVDVDVRHLDTFGVQETLEHEVVTDRVEFGDAERVGHHRAGRASTSWSHADPLVLRPVNEVLHHQEVTVVPHVADGLEFVLRSLSYLRSHLVVALRKPLEYERA